MAELLQKNGEWTHCFSTVPQAMSLGETVIIEAQSQIREKKTNFFLALPGFVRRL